MGESGAGLIAMLCKAKASREKQSSKTRGLRQARCVVGHTKRVNRSVRKGGPCAKSWEGQEDGQKPIVQVGQVGWRHGHVCEREATLARGRDVAADRERIGNGSERRVNARARTPYVARRCKFLPTDGQRRSVLPSRVGTGAPTWGFRVWPNNQGEGPSDSLSGIEHGSDKALASEPVRGVVVLNVGDKVVEVVVGEGRKRRRGDRKSVV